MTPGSGGRDPRPVAVVTGAHHPTGLGSARALKAAGARVWGVTTRPDAPCARSRAWERLIECEPPTGSWLAALEATASELDRPAFLLPTQDRLVEAISEARDRLHGSGGYRFRLPDPSVVSLLLDKTRFYQWAEARDIPVPASRVVHGPDGLRAAVEEIGYPVIVKPPYRSGAWIRLSPVEKVLRIRTPDDLEAVDPELLETADSFIVSRWIRGPDHAVHFCLACYDDASRMMASFLGRKLLQYPRETGSTAVCSGSDREDLRDLTDRIFREVGMRGLGSVEVKVDPEGRLLITEPTVGRPNLQSYAAVAAGVNLHALALRDAMGLPVTDDLVRPPRPRVWVEENALMALATGRNDTKIPVGTLARELLARRSLRGAYFSASDPLPMALLTRSTARRALRRLGRMVGLGRRAAKPPAVDPALPREAEAADSRVPGPGGGAAGPPAVSRSPEPVPALVLGRGVTALGVVRALGRRGIPLLHASAGDGVTARSRWHRPAPAPLPGPGDLPAYLADLPVEEAVLVPCSDELAVAVAVLPAELTDRFRTYTAPAPVLLDLIDKGRFLEAVRRYDVPHPATTNVDAAEDLEALDLHGSFFVKPRHSQGFFRTYGVKAFRPETAEDLRTKVDELLAAGEAIMVQDYVPGPASNHYFVDGFATDGGRVHATLGRRRLRMHPPDFGNSSFMVTVPPREVAPAREALERLFRGLDFRGIFSAEFKRDERDGALRILEVNARPWWYVEFAARVGLDVTWWHYESALGRPPGGPAPAYQVGRRLVYPSYDVSACLRLHGLPGTLRRAVTEWPGAHQPVFALDDPLPALRRWWEDMRPAVGRRVRRLRSGTTREVG